MEKVLGARVTREGVMNVRRDIDTGWPINLSLKRRISAIVRYDRVRDYKVGITGNPEKRSLAYRSYDEMVVLYKTTSEKLVRDMEWFITTQYPESDNQRRGGGGLLEGPPYYLYVVVKRQRRQQR